jgi:arabinofuranan 3-O-arabinosyltransferase
VSDATAVRRFRLVAVSLVLAAVSFVQQPGRTVADTKLDLVVDPGSFLSRALTMWDPQGFFGQVQNQAYGYLFPMGPFFWIGHVVDIEPWVVQRLWWTLVLVVAFLGAVKLCEVLEIGSPKIQIFAGLMFALSPRFLTVLGPSSIEVWPSAVAPWVLVPLVIGLRRGNPRRQAALSAVAVACVGGVNAVATFAVVPLAALWLLVAPAGPRRRALMAWWPPLVLLACAWWMVPLFLLGSYSPPFLDFIESSSVTTTAATAVDALRGTTNWIPYISPYTDAGRDLIATPIVILNSGIVLLLGVAGLTARHLPHRMFLVLGTFGGLVLVTLGHTGSVQGWGAGSIQETLDGVLAPLRNTHKFDVVVRLPLVLAAAHALTLLRRTGPSPSRESVLRRSAVALVAVSAVAGASIPAWTGHLANRGTFEAIPAYWQETADWLGDHASDEGGTTLLLPSSAFAEYLWGNTADEPLQTLAKSPWGVRNSIPLTPSGTIRFLDSVTDELAQGKGSPGLADTLRRAGVEFLVIRNDLRPEVTGGRTEAIYRTIRQSEGIVQETSFGPGLGGVPSIDLDSIRTFSHGGWASDHPAVEIFRVEPDPPGAVMTADTPIVVGAAGTLGGLDALGVSAPSVVLAQDQRGPTEGAPLVLTDGLRRAEAAFGGVDRIRSAAIARDEPFTLDRRAHDYLDPGEEKWLSVPELEGAKSLRVSSSQSEVGGVEGPRPETQAWSALDGDTRSAWIAKGDRGWIRLRLAATTDLGTVTIHPGLQPGVTQRLSIKTSDGPRTVEVSGSQPVEVPVGRVDELYVRGVNVDGSDFTLAELSTPALSLARPLVLPTTPTRWGGADSIVLGMSEGRRPGCLSVLSVVRCRAGVQEMGEDAYTIDRVVENASAGTFDVSVRTTPMAGEAYEQLVQSDLGVTVTASSTVNKDVRSSASRMLDGDAKTGWIAHPDDTDPTLSVRWPRKRTVSSVRFRTAPELPASLPASATLELDDGTQVRTQVENGVATFDPISTDHLLIHLESDKSAVDYLGDVYGSTLPVGVGELSFPGISTRTVDRSGDALTLPCGSGPLLTVDGRTVRTAVTTSRADLAEGRDATAAPCDGRPVSVEKGRNRIEVRASAIFETGRIVLQRTASTQVEASTSTTSGTRLVVEQHNANKGWEATASGKTVEPIRLNGWQQGWVVPRGLSTDVETTFGPGAGYRAALIGGALALLVLLGSLLVRGRRRTADTPGPRAPGALATVAVVATLGLVGGTTFVLLGLVGAAVAEALLRRRVVPAWAAGLPMVVALMLYVLRPLEAVGEQLPQLCVAVSLGAVAWTLVRDAPFLRRMNGSSTPR